MKILFVPDSIWGNASGHRSSKYLIKAFALANIDIALYAPKSGYTLEQHNILKEYKCEYYPQTEYKYSQQLIRKDVDDEFKSVLDKYKPDYVFYVGTIKNKVSIDYCLKNNIKYLYLPLTTEYYCVNTFAGLESGPCYGCLKGSIVAPFKNKCLPKDYQLINFVKDKAIELNSRKRVLGAHKIVGYSNDQLELLESYGVERGKRLKLPIFFDPDSDNNIKISSGDYFLIFGQFLTAKGWHVIPDVIKKSQGVKFKVILQEKNFNKFVEGNNLKQFVEDGSLVLQDFLSTHHLLLQEVAKSKAVLIPSHYHTTGEFSMLEALMFHKPVIAFNCGIHSEIFKDKENGMIADIGDLEGYINKIQQLNSNPELYLQVSRGSRELFNKLTSIENFKQAIHNALML